MGDGAWIRFRRVSADRAVITGEDGRFMLLPMAEIDALVAGDPGGARRRKLGEMGFLLDSDGQAPSRLAVSDEAAIHVLPLRELGAAAGEVVTGVLDNPRGFVHLELCDADPLGETGVGDIVRAARRGLSIRLRTRLSDMTPELAESLAKGRVAVRCLFEGPPDEDQISRIRMLRSAHSQVFGPGVEPFVVGVIPLREAARRAGAAAIVEACRAAGLAFVELTDIEHNPGVHREIVLRILDVQMGGTLFLEMGLALHLEALVARGAASRGGGAAGPEPRVVVWGKDGKGTSESAVGFGAGCGGCPYDPCCGRGLLRDPMVTASERRAGTPFCDASTGIFDRSLGLLASDEGKPLSAVFRTWMAAHERVAKHLADGE